MISSGVVKLDAARNPPQRGEPGLLTMRPLDERDHLRPEVVGEQRRVFTVERLQPVEVEVRDRNPPPVPLADRESRARDGARHTERPASAANERRLPGAELTLHEHEVARTELGRQSGSERLGLRRTGSLDASRHWRDTVEEAATLSGRVRYRQRLL
jgi:hypothetical protein